MSRIVLASASPRRLELLREGGWEVVCDVSGAEEIEGEAYIPAVLALENARLKWRAVAPRHGGVVVAADTVVTHNRRYYGKPASLADARRMLGELRGGTHEVVTGVVVGIASGRIEEFYESTRVTFRNVDDAFISSYVSMGDPLDKAAGYAAQGDAGQLIERIDGSRSNVIGLPMERLGAVLFDAFGMVPQRLQR